MHGRAWVLHYTYIASLDYLHSCTSMPRLNNVDFFVDYLPENGQKRPKHVAGLLHLIVYLCISLCSCWNKHCNKITRIVVIKPQASLTFVLGDESNQVPAAFTSQGEIHCSYCIWSRRNAGLVCRNRLSALHFTINFTLYHSRIFFK